MEYERGAENLPVDTNTSTGSPNAAATHVAREDCPHLADPEWEALQRLSTVIEEAAEATMLRTLSPTEQHGVALGFIMKEQREVAARATVSTPSTPSVEAVKLHVNSYVGREGEALLRWLVEVDTAITARRIVDPLSEELRQAFEPPQNEFRSRAEFLDLQHGKHDVHAYDQRARYLISNIVTTPIDEATKVVTFIKGLRDGPVKLLREYPGTLEAAITLAMQEEFSLRQDKLHANAPRSMPRPAMKPTRGPEPMDLSSATAAGPQQRRESTTVQKKLRQPAGAGPSAGDAVECVDIGHALSKTAAPSESHSHCKKKDDKPNLVILKVNSKRGVSSCISGLWRVEQLCSTAKPTRLDLEEVKLPRSLLEVRQATGVVVRTENRVVRIRFSYEEKKFVDELIVLDLDDKFDMVLGMPWLARHDPVIDWAKRTIVRFGGGSATESDGPVGAAHAPRGACDPPGETAGGAAVSDLSARTLTTERVVREKCEPNQKPQIRSDLMGSRSVKGDAVESTGVDTQVEPEWPVTEGSDLGASAPGADAIGPNIKGRSAVRRRGKRGASAPVLLQAVRTLANVPHRKCFRARVQPGSTTKQNTIKLGLIACTGALIPPTNKNMCAHVQPGCTTKRYTIRPGLIVGARGENPPAIKRRICPRSGLDKTRHAEPGSAREANGASAPSCASLGQGPRRYKQCLPGRHSNWRRPSRH
ncbi:unnamed protein product [Phytophthora fragariaefolia]|uniref:Unnamed protein product n=1 Tax=Phytophthora fragariaefolia TaxID=1490495 RepID=A0A9W6WXI9_9STRA|nr:unnamed protein product [Phytophthora fragariaefolia]